MKKLVIICIGLMIIISAQARADIIYANSCSRADIQAAHDIANDGDIIIIPAGDCTWDQDWPTVNISKLVSFQGQGPSSTILRKDHNRQYYGMFDFWRSDSSAPSSVDNIEVSGIKFVGADSAAYQDYGILMFRGPRNFKIHNCVFESFGAAGVIIRGDEGQSMDSVRTPWGVIYNCTFADCYMAGYGYGVQVIGDDDTWESPLVLGNEEAVFIEDCAFSGCSHCITCENRGKYVARYNVFDDNINAHIDAHGYESGSQSGTRSYEIYENIIAPSTPTSNRAIQIRGGDGVVFNNTLTNFTGSQTIYFCNEICPGCSYPCPDQVRDAYVWGNTNNGNLVYATGTTCGDPDPLIVENRDFYNFEKPGYTPYIYPHPLRTGNNPLNANINASPTSGWVPLTVNFTGTASGGTEPYTYSWDFGDDTSSSEQNPSHTYSDPGDYTVNLTVTDSESNQDNDSLIINASAIIIAPLQASFIASPTSGEVPLTVNFTGNATGGVSPYSYSWDFGDSTSSSEQNPSHTYSDAGDYTAYLTVTDSQSNQDSDSLTINVSAVIIPLVASFIVSPTSGEVPLTVNFTGNATGGVLPYSYSWDFGDSTSSSEQNPSHAYNVAGDYTVYLTVTDSESNQDSDSLTINVSAAIPPYLSCSPKSLYFGATTSGNETTDQYLRIINAGSGELTWNIEDDAGWLSFSPSSGTDRGKITVSVNASGLSLGLYVATITVSSPEAYNSPQYVSVNLRVYEPEQENPPFGSLDTPVNGSTVSGSIPITGWALDDIEVVRLEIKRNSDPVDLPEAIGSDGLVYIGDAVFVEGARPDVEKSYPDYPLNSRAGWGYMLLTNDLPYRGNGSFTIYGFAYDAGDNREEIGRKTILCDNVNRVKPFGTIDTHEQGESISGSDYINFGWALTPLPKTIPKDGSTISVWVDGVQVGHPVYDQYREDIATLYPEYNNSQGAVGYYYIDTTQFENGMHTITWSVMDDEGEADEIGARYFFIDNIETGSVYHGPLGLRSIYREDVEGRFRIGIKEVGKEYRPRVDSDRELNAESILNIQIEEMEPLRIVLEESSGGNMEYIGWGENKWKALPIGSTLDREKGIFSWIPTPGFIGKYVLHFAVTDGSYMSKPLRVVVNVIPKSCERELIRKIGKLPPLELRKIQIVLHRALL